MTCTDHSPAKVLRNTSRNALTRVITVDPDPKGGPKICMRSVSPAVDRLQLSALLQNNYFYLIYAPYCVL
jgi:hypothetical protein